MADTELTLRINAKTDEFVKKVEDAKTKVRSLSMQMSEIDKQLKTESVDRVAKLSEKLELAKRASEMAAKEAELYKEKIDKLSSKQEDLNKMTDKQKEALLKLSEQYETAKQRANTYSAEVNKLQKEYDENAESANDAEKATESLADTFNEAARETATLSKETNNSNNNIKDLFKRIAEGVSINLISDKLKKVSDFFANIAAKAWEAAKAVASFVKDYANEAVELAAAYQDAVGYSEQVYGNLAEESQKWVTDNSVRLRVYKGDLQSYVNSFGAIFNGFGYGSKQALEMSESLISLAADLRAATGKDINDVINSLTSGFTSSTKSLQQFGVVTNEAAIKAKALEMGLVNIEVNDLAVEKATLKVTEANKKASEALWKYGEGSLEYEKAQLAVTEAENAFQDALGGTVLELDRTQRTSALLQIVMEDLNFLLGQSDKEADNYNSQLDTMNTIMQNLKESIGEKLLPVYSEFLGKVNEFLQSDAGKAVMDALADSVGLLANKVLELLQDEKMTEWLANLKDEVPKVAEKIEEYAGKIAELIPQIANLIPQIETLTEKILTFLGVGDGAEMARAQENFIRCKEDVQDFADQSNISLEEATKVVQAFADSTDRNVSDIYGKWDEYAPLISQFYSELSTEADGTATDFETAMSKLPESVQNNLDATVNTDFSKADQLRAKVRGWADEIISKFNSVKNWVENPPTIDLSGEKTGWHDNLDWSWRSEASGGPVRAGRMYQVNDDHGRRKEMFVPAMDGYILNGGDTQRVINNSTNNSRSYGDLIVNVNSYGTDAASIADEIGAAVNRKLRMSGAW